MVLVKQFGKELGHDWIIFRSPIGWGGGEPRGKGTGAGERKRKKKNSTHCSLRCV